MWAGSRPKNGKEIIGVNMSFFEDLGSVFKRSPIFWPIVFPFFFLFF